MNGDTFVHIVDTFCGQLKVRCLFDPPTTTTSSMCRLSCSFVKLSPEMTQDKLSADIEKQKISYVISHQMT